MISGSVAPTQAATQINSSQHRMEALLRAPTCCMRMPEARARNAVAACFGGCPSAAALYTGDRSLTASSSAAAWQCSSSAVGSDICVPAPACATSRSRVSIHENECGHTNPVSLTHVPDVMSSKANVSAAPETRRVLQAQRHRAAGPQPAPDALTCPLPPAAPPVLQHMPVASRL